MAANGKSPDFAELWLRVDGCLLAVALGNSQLVIKGLLALWLAEDLPGIVLNVLLATSGTFSRLVARPTLG